MPSNIFRLLVTAILVAAIALISGCRSQPTGPPGSNQPGAANDASPARSADEIALLDAAINGDTAEVKRLLDKGVSPNTKDGDGRTPLTEAAFRGHTEIVKLLIDHGSELFAKKKDGETPVSMAAGHKDTADLIKQELQLIDVARAGDDQAVKELLDKGAYPSVKDVDGRTPLTEAAWNNHAQTVRLLLEKGADPNGKKNDGATPLSIANGRGYKEIAELLKKAGAK
jgi:uncharacterized protein